MSLPQMGPSFNFYKFRGMSETYKHKMQAMQTQVNSVDLTLLKNWGEKIERFSRGGSRVQSRRHFSTDYSNYFPPQVDQKAISLPP